jgi:hypothetical protein
MPMGPSNAATIWDVKRQDLWTWRAAQEVASWVESFFYEECLEGMLNIVPIYFEGKGRKADENTKWVGGGGGGVPSFLMSLALDQGALFA